MIPHTLYVGTIGEGIFRSQDHGDSFRRAMDGPGIFVESQVRALVVHPDNPQTLYMGTEHGLFRSVNGADSWEKVDSPLNGLQVWSILVRPTMMLVGACPSRLFRSDGRSWEEVGGAFEKSCPRIVHTRITSLAADGDDAWIGVEIDSTWRSCDAGRTWSKKPNGLSSLDIHSLAIVPARNGKTRRVLAATNNDLNLSDDDGDNWRKLDIGKQAPRSYCRGMTQIVGRPERILLGIGDGPPGWIGYIVVSEDAGETWRTAKMPGPANSTIWNFATHAADPSLVYASSVSGELYRSRDAGESWEKLPRECGEIRALAWAPV